MGETEVEVEEGSGIEDVGCPEVKSRCQRKGRFLLRVLQSKISGN